ncbi:iron-containing alcohol dehydrogenase [Undibacterium oligocarboniphilum]|uniref:Iron-containing alcohol dehydrogenase n=1 Tax=Undibacterium oligocarboniphilum TaxID=666702 RepID=A0A850QNP6_9BURK|nr:iron-containing alcohol dehydrogenase [Undibacterium oligocarboniphilum]MBC3870329.1 iron-containing alcohol dehydrogenase [Undibacterium oligocarboniphilum]NVO78320.1 iron-containing alcohol dehydrogenase [Undibacterium oligocarboniphilum]
MLNFDFYNPTQILFGQGRIADLNKAIPASAKVLLLYGGGSIKTNGVFDEVMTALGSRQVTEFTGIEPNPSYETLMKAVALIKESQIDFLLAVGGGSVIDGTKFIAAAALFEGGDPWAILEKRGTNITQALPFGTVLTLPATGSEMNSGAVVTRKSINAKLAFSSRHCFPKFSVLDPAKTYTLPVRQIGNGAVDAFVHVMEQYLTYPVNSPVQDRFAEGLLKTLIEEGPKALANPHDYDVRANLMWCATMALNGLIATGVPQDWATHMIGHELTALHGIDHAQTLAIVLPSMLRVRKEAKRAKLLQFAERVWDLREGNDDTRIDTAISKMQDYFEQMGVKTRLRDYGLNSSHISSLISALETHRMVALGEKRDVTPAISQQVLELSL